MPPQSAHTALGDVLTVIDLIQQVLRPLAEKRGLDTWEKIVALETEAERVAVEARELAGDVPF